jgi:hypothetical protein
VRWTHALQVERRHRHRRAQERRLQVQRHQQAEEQRVDAEVVQQRDEDGHEDHDDLGPFQRPAQHEDDHLAQHQELGLRQVHRHDPRLDQLLPAQQREGGREDGRADEQPAHHGAGLGGEEHAFLEHRQVELPVGHGQHEAAEGTHGRRFGGRGQAHHDGAQHRQDQHQQREEAGQQHLEDLQPLEAEQMA